MSATSTPVRPVIRDGLGESVDRPDGPPKVSGAFAFSSDLYARGMLWGRTLRSPHPAARIVSIDTSEAEAMAGVASVITAEDVPGKPIYGLEHPDQPVFASEVVRYQGEPIAAVAAEHPELAKRAIDAIAVEYDVLDPLTDPDAAIDAPPIHPDGNVIRHLPLRHGDVEVAGEVTVEGTYELGMQDQAFMGPESGLAIPAEDGGVELYMSTQWLHVDRDQVAACLGLPRRKGPRTGAGAGSSMPVWPPQWWTVDRDQVAACLGLPTEKVRMTLAGVGGAFGAREDVSLQIHVCLLALRTNRPVKMIYSREESFFGHVHRHPARMWFRHHADREGNLVKVEARLVLDGGAYASTSSAVLANAVCFATGPYRVPNAHIDGYAVRTNNPPCGAMRGFGVVQACFGHESQMDELAAALDMDPVELRLKNALETGDTLVTGQVITGTAPVREVIEAAVAHDPPPPPGDDDPLMALPGGSGLTAERRDVRRGTGVAVGIKNLMFSEGFEDDATAGVRLELGPTDQPLATVHSACAEVGQGFVTLAQQITRSTLGVEQVLLRAADTSIGSAGSTSASRQTWMSGGAVELACNAVRDELLERASRRSGIPLDGDEPPFELRDGEVVEVAGAYAVAVTDLLADGPIEHVREHKHAPTQPLDENGQGNAHVSFAFAAHRAVVDVDPDLGLVRVVQISTGQDVGRALNPRAVIGQIEGGIAQGVGLAVMEEIVVEDGQIRNPSFTDYLIPTALDMPEVVATLIEQPEPGAPFGAKGVGEPPTISSTPAVVAAIRDATGLPLTRVPIRPHDIALAAEPQPTT